MQATVSASRNAPLGASFAGQTVDGRFPLQKYLGGSATRAVFLTQIEGAEAKAAIKLVLANSCDAEAQLALWRNAAKLSHPHLIRIFDGGRCWLAGHELIFVVTDFAEENLGEVLPRRALTPTEGYAMLRPVLQALKYLHAQGLVHGHLRPSNVMAVSEQLKISSDGICPPGGIKGLHEPSLYDPPELTAGQISPAADTWCLGATLTEALTNRSARHNGAYRGLPQPFAEIVQHCLRDEPAARWTIDDIEAYLQAAAKPAMPEHQVAEEGLNLRRFLPLGLVALLMLIIVATYSLVRHSGQQVQPAVAKPAPVAINKAPTQPPALQSSVAESTPGSVLKQVSPSAAQSALRTVTGRLKVRVRVEVDPAGNVSSAKFATEGPSRYFGRLSMEAAQQWKFTPPKQNGQAVPSRWTLLFEFTRGGISQQASQVQ
jgi:TonB family protein